MMVHQFFHFPYTYAIINLYVSIRCIFIHDIPDGAEIYHYFSIKGVIDYENYRISRRSQHRT